MANSKLTKIKKSHFLWFRKHKKTTNALIWFRNAIRGNREYKYFWLISLFSLILVIGLWVWNWLALNDYNDDVRGTHGDMFGAVNAIFSGLAFSGIIISLYLQRIDLKTQHKEIQQTNREFKIQNDTLQIQKFENQYYKMIDLHKANVEEMKITFFDHIKVPHYGPGGKEYNNQEVLRDIEGRKIFVGMLHEFNIIYSTIKDCCVSIGLDLDSDTVCEYAYKIFFYGKNSRKFDFKDSPASFKRKVIEELQIIQDGFFTRHQDDKKSKSDENYYLKFYPFEGHESRLAHYYRHLFQTVKYVVQQEDRKLITYDESRQYLRVLRAQLSNAEQVLLYYNYRADFGSNWDYIGKKGYQFLTRYRMIHNIPFDNIANGIEDPREHFKLYIKNHTTKDDPLFEGGDYA